MCSVRRIIDFLLDLIYPPKCPGCDVPIDIRSTDALCHECRVRWNEHKDEICRRCGQPIRECWCGIPENRDGYIDHEYHLVQYITTETTVIKRLIYSVKNFDNKHVTAMIAEEMYNELYLTLDYNDLVVTAVPRSPGTKRRIGHDQSINIANAFCAVSGLQFADVLIHRGNKKQKTLSYSQRVSNADKSYGIINGAGKYIKGKNVILIDDVVTTGATVTRCARMLKWKGAARVIVFSIAKTV